MFTSTINSINKNVSSSLISVNAGVSKRSKVCDADANGNVNVNCRR